MHIKARYFLLTVLISCTHGPSWIDDEPARPLIAIQPLGDFDETAMLFLSGEIAKAYDCRTIILKPEYIPRQYFNDLKSPRYAADSLLIFLRSETNDSINYVLGITHEDIFTTKKDNKGSIKEPAAKYAIWGIFGLGYTPGKSCVVSDFRLQCDNKERKLNRLKNVSLHELGHNFGLSHCLNKDCIMSDANESVKTIDNESRLCDVCRKKMRFK